MSRRVALPGADELFRRTQAPSRPEPQPQREPAEAPSAEAVPVAMEGGVRTTTVAPKRRRNAPGRPTGRIRHEEKITVYVSPEELIDLENAKLSLRAQHGLAVDRGRIVREALAVVVADLEQRGDDSIIVRRLRGL
ncbi:MAG: hypothetical protein ACYC3W_11135 [Candidatus Nanopelagicales bacterium]